MKYYRLVIADDEKLIRESLANFIDWEKLGYELVLLAEDGDEIIENIDKLRPDVILTDIQMRRTTGLQVTEYVTKRFPRTVVVLLSGYREFEYAKQAISFGVQEYLLKPISISAINSTFIKIREKLEESEEEEKQQKEMVKTLRSYKQAAVEKLMELGKMGILTESSCMAYMDRFDMTSMKENVVCYEAELITQNFGEYEELALDILSNLFNMAAGDYGFYHSYVFYQEAGRGYRIVMTMDPATKPLAEETWIAEMEKNIYGICRSWAKLRIVKRAVPFVEFVMDLKEEPAEFLFRDYAIWKDNHEGYLQAVSSQCLMILNMAPDVEEVLEGIWDTFQECLKAMRIPDQIEQMSIIFESIYQKIDQAFENKESVERKPYPYAVSVRDYFDRNIREIYAILKENQASEISVTEQVKKVILDRISGTVTLKEAADSVYLSPNYFSRLFREQSGENFSEYSIRVKMEKAAELLRETRYRVYEVCDFLGYRNIKYFYKLFKRIYNMTPSEFRERLMEGEEKHEKSVGKSTDLCSER